MEEETYIPAKNLGEVFERFNPEWEIDSESPFVEPMLKDPLEGIRNKLRMAKFHPSKIFFTGHRGAGKTLQVDRLIKELLKQDEFLPFYLDIKTTFDPKNLEYQDIIFGIVSTVYETYIEPTSRDRLGLGYNRKGKIKKELVDRLEKWGRETIKEQKKKTDISGGIDLNILKLIQGKLKASKKTAEMSREIIESTIEQLLSIYSDMVAEIDKNERKKVLVIIDGMDKIDFSKAREFLTIFLDKLLQPESSLLYVIPVSLSYQMTLVDIEDRLCRIDNIPVFKPVGQYEKFDAEAYEFCRKLTQRRMDKTAKLISDDALEEIVRLSAGVIRLLISNVQKASEKAMARNCTMIETEDVNKVKQDYTYFFQQVLTYSDDFKEGKARQALKICGEIIEQASRPLDDLIGPLVHHLMVIEYPNDPRKYGIHPAMRPIINEYLT